MADIHDISDIAGKFKSISELKKYTEDLFKKNKILVEKIQKQNEEIDHLKKLLDGVTPVIHEKSPNGLPYGQLLCEMEILRLEKIASGRALTMEEAKKFDIYNKNLLAIKKPKLEKEDDHKLEYDEKSLLEIVKSE